MEEWHKPGGHPCASYRVHWEAERRIKDDNSIEYPTTFTEDYSSNYAIHNSSKDDYAIKEKRGLSFKEKITGYWYLYKWKLSNIVRTPIILVVLGYLVYVGLQSAKVQSILGSTVKSVSDWVSESSNSLGSNSISSRPKILGADSRENEVILEALNNTDKNIVWYVKSVTVIPDLNGLKAICEDAAMGCADSTFSNGALSGTNIYLASTKNYKGLCNSFENTIYHEIGHVVWAYYRGEENIESETFANNYAANYQKDKCAKCDEWRKKYNSGDYEPNETIFNQYVEDCYG